MGERVGTNNIIKMKKIDEKKAASEAAKFIGKRGGLKTKKNHGSDYYVKLGRLGGRASKNKKEIHENNITQSGSEKIKN